MNKGKTLMPEWWNWQTQGTQKPAHPIDFPTVFPASATSLLQDL
jgi:hypothetical protein